KYAFGAGPKQLAELRNNLYRDLPAAFKTLPTGDQQLFPEAYRDANVPEQKKPKPIGLLWYGLVLILPALFLIYSALLKQEVRDKMDWLNANPLAEAAPQPEKMTWQAALLKEAKRLNLEAKLNN